MTTSDATDNAADNNGTSDSQLATGKTAALATTTSKTAGRRKVGAAKSKAIELYQPSSLPNMRPIASSGLDIVKEDTSYPGYRPVSAAHLVVINDQTLPNQRPVVKSGLVIVDTDTLPNHRPVVASKFPLPNSESLPNHRPIASNQIDDPYELMGFLD
ncbi:hypothetical protein [Altericista sp. CCNU0014]|uniref:hypothetical protein n=1 Tax=Altericista sp. CCNU0014 TaxID=3082949 RepID=UPI00384AAB57